jgi:Ni,Fe-hydrogenase III small subunit
MDIFRDRAMEGNIDRESQLLTDAVEWILTPVTAGGCSPVPTEIIKELSLLICAIWRERFMISQQHGRSHL